MDGTVFNIQRFSLFDGPGVRTVVFLKGCPLRCIWCHNPEGLSALPQIMYSPDLCIGCMSCSVCEKGLHENVSGMHSYNREGCTSCGECASACPSSALSVAGYKASVEDVMKEILKDRMFFGDDGGVTFSGGEPLLQHEFLTELLKAAKEEGLTTAVETSGYADRDALIKAARYTDLFLYDYKITGEENHVRYCGVSNRKILDNLALLDELNANVVLRCPIITGINDNEEHVKTIGEISKHSCVMHTELEPYHKLGVSKRDQLSMPQLYEGEAPDKKILEGYCEIVTSISNKKCIIS